MKYCFILAAVLTLVGCGASPIVPYDQGQNRHLEALDFPPIAEIQRKSLGEVLVKKGSLELREALTISKQTKFNKAAGDSSIMTCALAVEPQTIYLRGQYKTEKVQAECYGAINTRRTLADGSTNFNCPGAPLISADICKQEDGTIFLAFLSQKAQLKQDFDNLKFSKKAAEDSDGLVQELIYNGIDGDKAKFVYKEYSSNMKKPDFFQEFYSRFKSNKEVVFKNMKLEIIRATDQAIEYRLKQNF